MLPLSAREELRAIRETGETGRPRIVRGLVKQGLVEQAIGGKFFLTTAGETEYQRIMRSGDGPEALKDMFRL